MGVKCQILLQKAKEGVSRPGQPVLGTVNYFIDKPTKFGSITINFVGKGRCQWTESDSDNKTTTYSNEEEYVNICKNLFIASNDEKILVSGTFEYPFDFLLPVNIPTSIKNSTCTIEYKVIVQFVKENFFKTKHTFDAEVPVYGFVDPCFSEPLIFGLQKDLFSLTSNNNINVKAEIDKTFLTPGENITLRLTVNNDSDVPITIKTELVKYFTYVADYNLSKKIDTEFVKTTESYSPSIKKKSASNLTLVVPTLPSMYSIQHSKILIGEYKVRVTAKVPFPHINAVVEIPVVVGERRDHLGVVTVGIDDRCPSYSELVKEDDCNMDSDNVGECL